ncbi:phosphatidylinositol 3-kinase regulatory subunit beta-like, partial [Sceloporus undulatus]|uniref:phosphatidylinositol 3-kinase regulatory subunit beta-like n=1 Tax=Sceloporus undulatus TaxID=8520 RepID=UPI001C4D1CA4
SLILLPGCECECLQTERGPLGMGRVPAPLGNFNPLPSSPADAASTTDLGHQRQLLLSALEHPGVLPVPHLLTFQFLLCHLGKVAAHAESSGLCPRVLGEIFGPLLLGVGPAASAEVTPEFPVLFLQTLLQTKDPEADLPPP